MQFRSMILGAAAASALAASTQAATVAYWRFETARDTGTGIETPAVAGTDVPHAGGDGAYLATIADVSGNGNHMSAFTQGSWAGFHYVSVTPSASVPSTGAANALGIQNTGGYPAAFTSPTDTASGTNLRTWEPATFTVEGYYKPENTNWYRTFVGRDANHITTTGDGNLAAFYLGLLNSNHPVARYTDKAGVLHEVVGASTITDGYTYNGSNPDGAFGGSSGVFHHYAVTNDGASLNLYVDGVLDGTTALTGTSSNLAMNNGSTSTGVLDNQPGKWSVGRGMYNGDHGDRAYGVIDEVRISDVALAPSAFLVSVPEPASITAIAGVMGLLVGRRQRRS